MNKPSLATPRKNVFLTMNGASRLPPKRTIVVLGVERGGTSMAAGVVRALGICMGQRAGLNHEDPLFLTDERDRLANRIKMRNQQEDVWGFKVPKAALMLDFYGRRLRNPFYIVVWRNSMAVMDSWMQRGAETPIVAMDRIMAYQNAIFAFLRQTRAPVLMLNYERALQDEASKLETVDAIAGFTGCDLTPELQDRAIGMMTGDGRGYVNLPEHFFAVTPLTDDVESGEPLSLVQTGPGPEPSGWTVHEKNAPRLIYAMADQSNLPERFILEFDADFHRSMDLASNPLRVYFNFTGQYFPGHCNRPPIRVGRNRYLVETSGLATAFAFGPLSSPTRFRLEARAYAAPKS